MLPKKNQDLANIILASLFYLCMAFVLAHLARIQTVYLEGINDPIPISMAYRDIVSSSDDYLGLLNAAFNETFSHPFYFTSFNFNNMKAPLLVWTVAYGYFLFYRSIRRRVIQQDAPGREHGSAKWNKDMKSYNKTMLTPYTKEDVQAGRPDPNIILAEGLKLSLTGRKVDHEFKRNANVLVIGGSGTGKTLRSIKPNILQMNCSMVVTDPSGEIMRATGIPLLENGYKMKIFSTSDMEHSNCYNPFDYIYTETGKIDETKVRVMVTTFMKNVDPNTKKGGGDPFWDKAALAWMTFAVFYLAEFQPISERNMYNVLRLAQAGKADEESSSSATILDKIVADARAKNPKAKCFVAYDTFKLAPSKTANSILITLGVNLEPFGSSDAVRNMTTTSYLCKRNKQGKITKLILDKNGQPIRDENNLDLEKIADTKTVLFVNIPQANGAYNFLVSMMYSQLFDELYTRGEKICPNRYHIFDETGFAIASQFLTKELAERRVELGKNAVLKVEESKNGSKRYFLYNKDAKAEESLPEFVTLKRKNGYLEEVYSERVGKELIERYRTAKVEKSRGSELPVPLRCLLDEFANIGEIPEFNNKLATMRKYMISCTIILQSLAQIKEKYNKLWESLVGNCDTMVFLGSSENETDKYVSEKIGKTTIRVHSASESKGKSGSYSDSYQYQQRDLLDAAEVSKINNRYCIVSVRGLNPFYLPKYDYFKHPHYKITGDANPDFMVTDLYLADHFTCTDKEILRPEIEEQVKDDAKIIRDRKNPDGVHRSVETEMKVVKDDKDVKSAMGLPLDTSSKAFARNVKAASLTTVMPNDLTPLDRLIADPEEMDDKETANVFDQNMKESSSNMESVPSAKESEDTFLFDLPKKTEDGAVKTMEKTEEKADQNVPEEIREEIDTEDLPKKDDTEEDPNAAWMF